MHGIFYNQKGNVGDVMESKKVKKETQRDPFWLAIAAIFVVIAVFLLVEHSRVAIAIVGLIAVMILLYFYSDRFQKKGMGGDAK